MTEPEDEPGEGRHLNTEEVTKAAEEFLRGLLRELGAKADITSEASDDALELNITGDDLGTLIGPKGSTLLALQELTRTSLQRRGQRAEARVLVDVNGYRKRRSEALARFAREVADGVLASGKKRALEPMPPSDRKVVHDAVSGVEGIATVSEGEEPNRRVVILPVQQGLAGSAAPADDLQSAG